MYERINEEKRKALEKKLGCKFCSDGDYAEMSLALSEYQEKTNPISDVKYDFYWGNMDLLRSKVALVDEKWIQYFEDKSLIFCGYAEGEPVSFCLMEEDADCILSFPEIRIGSIGCVGTVPALRGRGIGLRMVDLATVYLQRKGCEKSYIHYTHIEKWYAKLGYKTFARFSFN